MTKADIINRVLLRHPKMDEEPCTITLNQALIMMDMWLQEHSANKPVSGSGGNERGILLNDFLIWMGKEKLMGSSVSSRKALIDEFEKSFNSR